MTINGRPIPTIGVGCLSFLAVGFICYAFYAVELVMLIDESRWKDS